MCIRDSVSPVGYQNWINAGAGKSGILWGIVSMKKESRIDFIFCTLSPEINRKRFEYLVSKKKEIEENFGDLLIWDFKEIRKQHYIKSLCPFGGFDDEGNWTIIHNDLVERLIRFKKAIGPYIKDF